MKRQRMSHKDLFTIIGETIARSNRVVISVPRAPKGLGFAYTIGNQEKALPELLLIGNFDPDEICILLNYLSNVMIENKAALTPGLMTLTDGKNSIKIINAGPDAKSQYTVQAGQFYANEDYKVQQVLICDENQRWPGDPLCHKAYKVPVLWPPFLG